MLSSSKLASSVVVLFLAGSSVFAQTPPSPPTPPPTPSPDTETQAAATAAPARRTIEYGVRFGPSFGTLTSVETFDPEKVGRSFEPTLNFGGYLNLGFGGPLSLQPEILFVARGHRIHDKDAQPTIDSQGQLKAPSATHVVLIRYLEFPLLIRASKRTHENTTFYLIAGPAFALKRKAVIREVANPGRLVEIDDLVKSTLMSYVVGGGLQHKLWLVDARLTRGIGDIAVSPVPGPVKVSAFSVLMGVRF